MRGTGKRLLVATAKDGGPLALYWMLPQVWQVVLKVVAGACYGIAYLNTSAFRFQACGLPEMTPAPDWRVPKEEGVKVITSQRDRKSFLPEVMQVML